MQEIDINKLKAEIPEPTESNSQPPRHPLLSGSLPYKRITINNEALSAMENELSSKMAEDEPEQTQNQVDPMARPTAPDQVTGKSGGYKLDGGKPRWELAPFDAFEAMVRVQTWAISEDARGENAYPERNWERGMAWSRVFGAMIRHAWRWWMGKMTGRSTLDDESGMSHMWHAFTCAGFLVAYELRKMDKFDDRPSFPSESQHNP
jgi:hypothetical protein